MAVRYVHVADDLRRRIASGAVPVGGQLPSEDELAAEYRVGRPTLRRALEALQDEGLVEKFHGRGNFVRRPLNRITYIGGSRSGVTPGHQERLSVRGTVSEVLAQGDLPALLRVDAGTPLMEYVYLAEQDGLPYGLAHVYAPRDIASAPRSTDRFPWDDDIRDRLTDSGQELAATTNRIATRFPTADEAKALQITPRTSVLTIERVSIDTGGQVAEAARLVLPGDRADVVFTSPVPSEEGASQ